MTYYLWKKKRALYKIESMKILAVCQYYYPENIVFTNICEELVKQGHDVTVLTGKPNYGYGYIIPEYKNVKFEIINGVKVHRVNLKPRKHSRLSIINNYLSFWSSSKRWVRHCKEKFDIVYSMSLSPVTILSAGNLYKKKHHVKHVVHCVDLWPESVLVTHAVRKNSLTYKILYKWSKNLYEKVDHVIFGSPSYGEYFKDVLKLNKKSSFAALPSLVEKREVEPVELDGKVNILYCGNLGTIQLINLIPESMSLVEDKDIKFHVIGMGPKTEELKSLIKQYGLEDRVIYHGPIPAKRAAAYFDAADILYVSLKGDGYVGKTIPNKLAMSMAFGKPIIGVLEGDGKNVLNESKGGFVSQPDKTSISVAINKMAKLSPEERKRLGDLNRAYYQDHFSIEKTGQFVSDILLQEVK